MRNVGCCFTKLLLMDDLSHPLVKCLHTVCMLPSQHRLQNLSTPITCLFHSCLQRVPCRMHLFQAPSSCDPLKQNTSALLLLPVSTDLTCIGFPRDEYSCRYRKLCSLVPRIPEPLDLARNMNEESAPRIQDLPCPEGLHRSAPDESLDSSSLEGCKPSLPCRLAAPCAHVQCKAPPLEAERYMPGRRCTLFAEQHHSNPTNEA